jgi:hypothetical protein
MTAPSARVVLMELVAAAEFVQERERTIEEEKVRKTLPSFEGLQGFK